MTPQTTRYIQAICDTTDKEELRAIAWQILMDFRLFDGEFKILRDNLASQYDELRDNN